MEHADTDFLNWELIDHNIAEAVEQLQEILDQIAAKSTPDEIEFSVQMKHAFHHLNFAWNARRASTEQYEHLTEDHFYEWGLFPDDLI